MSYSLSKSCHVCKKKDRCTDSAFIEAAISGIHQVNWSNGTEKKLHLGYGTIELKCQGFEDEKEIKEE